MSFVSALWRAGAGARGLSTPTHLAPFVGSAASSGLGGFGAPTLPLMQAADDEAGGLPSNDKAAKPSSTGAAAVTKADLVKTVAEAHEISKAQSKRIVDTVFSTITDTLADKKKIKISGLGSFSTYESAARMARNPRDNTRLQVPSKTRIRFKANKSLKETLQGKSS